MPWSLEISSDSTTGAETLAIAIEFRRPVDVFDTEVIALQRWICHALVNFMPSSGIPELRDTLINLWEYYSVPRKTLVDRASYLPTTEPVTVNVTRTVNRPEFSVEYDAQ